MKYLLSKKRSFKIAAGQQWRQVFICNNSTLFGSDAGSAGIEPASCVISKTVRPYISVGQTTNRPAHSTTDYIVVTAETVFCCCCDIPEDIKRSFPNYKLLFTLSLKYKRIQF